MLTSRKSVPPRSEIVHVQVDRGPGASSTIRLPAAARARRRRPSSSRLVSGRQTRATIAPARARATTGRVVRGRLLLVSESLGSSSAMLVCKAFRFLSAQGTGLSTTLTRVGVDIQRVSGARVVCPLPPWCKK